MARIRTIKPEFWVDDVMVELSFEARLLFIGIWNFADDEGYIEDKPKRIKMMIFPADDVLIEDSLNALCEAGRLQSFDSDQGPLLQVANWGRHQKVNRATPTRFTGIVGRNRSSSVSSAGARSEASVLKGKEGKGRDLRDASHLSSEVADATPRPEIEHLLNLLDAEIIRNGGKPPSRTKRNLDAARLLLDRDGLSVAQVEKAIRWCQADEFWRSNILSMSKLREKYETLRLAAMRQSSSKASKDDRARGVLELGARMQAEEDRRALA